MATMMTLQKIQDRFAAEWVLLADPQTSEALEIQAGHVVWHSKDRDEVCRKAQGISLPSPIRWANSGTL
jgi:hypothetical protein